MKNIYILFFFICASFSGYSQVKNTDTIAQKKSFWEKYSNPSLDNSFTLHFKNFLSPNLIASADLSKRKKEIALFFNLDKKNRFINIRTNSENNVLNNAIINAFNLLSIDDLNLTEKSPLHNYSLQIICKENNKPLLKCSSQIVYSTPAIYSGCEKSTKNYATLNKCNNTKLRNFIIDNFDYDLAKRTGLKGVVSIYAIFIINKDTRKFTDLKVKTPNDVLKYETKRVLFSFPEVTNSGYLLGKLTNTKYSLPLKIALK